MVSSDGGRLETLSPRVGEHGYADVSPSISPDGTRIVFSTLRHGPKTVFNEPRNQEISTASREGNDYQRLTNHRAKDASPAWSPDGKHIAFISGRVPESHVEEQEVPPSKRRVYRNLMVTSSAGSDPAFVTTTARAVVDLPVWSPDSLSLAFLLEEETERERFFRKALYTVGVDGTGLRRLFDATVRPAWSPDGSRIAFGLEEVDDTVRILTVRPDGTDLREVVGPGRFLSVYNLSWSSDGSEIRFQGIEPRYISLQGGTHGYLIIHGIHVVSPDGSNERLVAEVDENELAAWSPDDSTIAVFQRDTSRAFYRNTLESRAVLSTMYSDGSHRRVLVSLGIGGLVAQHSDWRSRSSDLMACGEGLVVPEPEKNPGLVKDCETLIKSRNDLSGETIPLLWNRNIPIADWAGVSVDGDPPRVRVLSFLGQLQGRIPAALGDLDELEHLSLSEYPGGGLRGQIPPELGNLTQLKSLSLPDNQLSGPIPSQLGNLVNLRHLSLHSNSLYGSIPPELGNLADLDYFDLSGNRLSGNIPPELGKLKQLRYLNLKGNNRFTGCIPDGLAGNQYLKNYHDVGLLPC